jgi:hypothetical protein
VGRRIAEPFVTYWVTCWPITWLVRGRERAEQCWAGQLSELAYTADYISAMRGARFPLKTAPWTLM